MNDDEIKSLQETIRFHIESFGLLRKIIERLTARLSLLEDVVVDLLNKRNVDEGLDTVECLGNVDCTQHGRPHTYEEERKSRV